MRASLLLPSSSFALLIAFALASFATPATAQKKPRKDKKEFTPAIVLGEVGKDMDAFMNSEKNFDGGFCGVVLVSKGGEVLLEKGYGVMDADKKTPMTADALFDWSSVTETFTAAAVLKLEMMRKLSIEDPLQKFFPKCPEDKADIPLRMLLNHTSGTKGGKDPAFDAVDLRDRKAVIDAVLHRPMVAKPGTVWEYDAAAYILLGALVEEVSGATLEKFCAEQLFGPAGMEARWIGDPKLELARVPRDDRGTGVQLANGPVLTWGYKGAGGVVATAHDMLLWHEALKGDKVLNKAEKEKYYKVGLHDCALGWEVKKLDDGLLEYAHSGHTGKTATYFQRWPEADIVVVLAYSYEPSPEPGERARELARMAKRYTPSTK